MLSSTYSSVYFLQRDTDAPRQDTCINTSSPIIMHCVAELRRALCTSSGAADDWRRVVNDFSELNGRRRVSIAVMLAK